MRSVVAPLVDEDRRRATSERSGGNGWPIRASPPRHTIGCAADLSWASGGVTPGPLSTNRDEERALAAAEALGPLAVGIAEEIARRGEAEIELLIRAPGRAIRHSATVASVPASLHSDRAALSADTTIPAGRSARRQLCWDLDELLRFRSCRLQRGSHSRFFIEDLRLAELAADLNDEAHCGKHHRDQILRHTNTPSLSDGLIDSRCRLPLLRDSTLEVPLQGMAVRTPRGRVANTRQLGQDL